jgi:hypothetical protein
MLGEVERLRELLAKATPGEWRWSTNGNIVPTPYTDTEIAAVYSEHDDDTEPANAAAIIAAIAFLRSAAFEEMVRNDARYRHVITRGKLPMRCTAGYYYEDGVLHPTPEAAIDAAMSAEGAGNG